MADSSSGSATATPADASSFLGDQLPLAGIRVVELGQFIAGPGSGVLLAELGASVIKVEPPSGDSSRSSGTAAPNSLFLTYNRGKRSLALDLHDPRCKAAVIELICASDVVIQNMRPGIVERFGLGPDQIRAVKPDIIYVSLSGFGRSGPAAGRPGFDVAAQAVSGMMSINGDPSAPPVRVGFTVVDCASTHVLAEAVLAGLVRRERFGLGSTLEVSLLGVAMHLQSSLWTDYLLTGVEPKRRGNPDTRVAPSGDLLQTRDGFVIIAAYVPTHWRRLCAALGVPELADDPRFVSSQKRVKNRREMMELLSSTVTSLTSAEVVQLLTAAGVVAGEVNTYRQARVSDEVVTSGVIHEVDGPDGYPMSVIRNPVTSEDWGTVKVAAVPTLGGDTVEILTELGLAAREIEGMIADGVAVDGREQQVTQEEDDRCA